MENNEIWSLIELQKKINRIENNNSDYVKSPKWQKYRKQQDLLYKKIQKENDKGIER
jgi:hypothetical protein